MKTIKLKNCAITESKSILFTKNTKYSIGSVWITKIFPIELFLEHQWLDKSQHVLIERTHKWRFSNHKSSPIDKILFQKLII